MLSETYRIYDDAEPLIAPSDGSIAFDAAVDRRGAGRRARRWRFCRRRTSTTGSTVIVAVTGDAAGLCRASDQRVRPRGLSPTALRLKPGHQLPNDTSLSESTDPMPDLLIELFSEEIPARMQARAREDLKKLVSPTGWSRRG